MRCNGMKNWSWTSGTSTINLSGRPQDPSSMTLLQVVRLQGISSSGHATMPEFMGSDARGVRADSSVNIRRISFDRRRRPCKGRYRPCPDFRRLENCWGSGRYPRRNSEVRPRLCRHGGTERIGDYSGSGTASVVAIGSNVARERLQAIANSAGLVAATLVHLSAVLAKSVVVGAGAVVMAGVAINANARLGIGVIVNTGAVIDHDCQMGIFVTLRRASCYVVRFRSVLGPLSAWSVSHPASGDRERLHRRCRCGGREIGPSGARVVGVPAQAQ